MCCIRMKTMLLRGKVWDGSRAVAQMVTLVSSSSSGSSATGRSEIAYTRVALWATGMTVRTAAMRSLRRLGNGQWAVEDVGELV